VGRKGASWVCVVCNEVVRHPGDRMEKRIEYRCQSGLTRYRTVKVAELCRGCVDKELERPGGPPVPEQPGLFG